ncbi:hypothetical protein FIU86_05095 [Roseovarius sp. THAF9]|uniref:hypothetical protein n=1 Tax=Roseovarius sp. THAF9 TaxID=2587847 RepID=UPI0012689281|nr:hypothetical protein [Roseovarius sp. THAF9]QFT92207.1 hypothetical protein FIU86_05095 [Roseovarius sp. THAF9]
MTPRKLTYAALAVTLLLALPASAQDYAQDCNANGYVITAARGTFAGAPVYLGKSCDAFHAAHGEGKWCWQNNGINVNLPTGNWLLAKVELTCQNAALDELACSCIDFSNGGN